MKRRFTTDQITTLLKEHEAGGRRTDSHAGQVLQHMPVSQITTSRRLAHRRRSHCRWCREPVVRDRREGGWPR